MESAAPGDTVSSPVSKEVQHGAKLDSLKSAIERMKGVVAPQPKIRLHSISSEYPRYNLCAKSYANFKVFGLQKLPSLWFGTL